MSDTKKLLKILERCEAISMLPSQNPTYFDQCSQLMVNIIQSIINDLGNCDDLSCSNPLKGLIPLIQSFGCILFPLPALYQCNKTTSEYIQYLYEITSCFPKNSSQFYCQYSYLDCTIKYLKKNSLNVEDSCSSTGVVNMSLILMIFMISNGVLAAFGNVNSVVDSITSSIYPDMTTMTTKANTAANQALVPYNCLANKYCIKPMGYCKTKKCKK